MEQIYLSIVWKADGMKWVIIFLFQIYPLYVNDNKIYNYDKKKIEVLQFMNCIRRV